MAKVQLVRHDVKYADKIFEITNIPEVIEHLSFRNETLDDVIQFIHMVQKEESQGKTVSRVIIDEKGNLIGTTSLMKIEQNTGQADLGTWLDKRVWGQGYNVASKYEILKIAFLELNLKRVFVGARRTNLRSIRAQEKLEYVTMDVGNRYPFQWEAMEKKENCPVILNVIYREDFLHQISRIDSNR